jgi:hypothetical protein
MAIYHRPGFQLFSLSIRQNQPVCHISLDKSFWGPHLEKKPDFKGKKQILMAVGSGKRLLTNDFYGLGSRRHTRAR